MEKKVVLYLHPANERGQIPVSRIIVRNGKKQEKLKSFVCWFDPPGAWFDDKWNVYIDGCDHECNSLEECKEWPAMFHGFDEVEYVETEEVWKW